MGKFSDWDIHYSLIGINFSNYFIMEIWKFSLYIYSMIATLCIFFLWELAICLKGRFLNAVLHSI